MVNLLFFGGIIGYIIFSIEQEILRNLFGYALMQVREKLRSLA